MQHWPAQTAFILLLLLPSALPSTAAEAVSSQTEQYFDLPLTGSIDLENTDGVIDVVGWYQPRVRVASVRKAYTVARLEQIEIETKLSPNSLSIRTIIPATGGIFADRSGTVGFTLTVPESARLHLKLLNGEVTLQGLRGANAKVELKNGRMTARNCFARIDAQTENGLMELFFNWWENLPASCHYVLGQGKIVAWLPANARFQVAAQTGDGWIQNAFGLRNGVTKDRGQMLQGTTGPNPGISLGMSARHGNIRIDSVR